MPHVCQACALPLSYTPSPVVPFSQPQSAHPPKATKPGRRHLSMSAPKVSALNQTGGGRLGVAWGIRHGVVWACTVLLEPQTPSCSCLLSSPSGQSTTLNDLVIQDMLPGDLYHYYSYQGSLTTPPCTENVHWFVLADSVKISKTQVTHGQSLPLAAWLAKCSTHWPHTRLLHLSCVTG